MDVQSKWKLKAPGGFKFWSNWNDSIYIRLKDRLFIGGDEGYKKDSVESDSKNRTKEGERAGVCGLWWKDTDGAGYIVLKGISPECDAEAPCRPAMMDWRLGTVRGKPVSSRIGAINKFQIEVVMKNSRSAKFITDLRITKLSAIKNRTTLHPPFFSVCLQYSSSGEQHKCEIGFCAVVQRALLSPPSSWVWSWQMNFWSATLRVTPSENEFAPVGWPCNISFACDFKIVSTIFVFHSWGPPLAYGQAGSGFQTNLTAALMSF